jgi:hypothetical protein
MIEIGGVMRASTSQEANKQADKIQKQLDRALEKIRQAKEAHHDLCMRLYPVGSRVEVHVGARRNPTHEVIAVNQYGWLRLRNIHTGTERGLSASSSYIRPSRCWYQSFERKTT